MLGASARPCYGYDNLIELINLTNQKHPETAVTTEYKFNELYTFTNDAHLDIRYISLFVFCDKGGYVLDINTKQIDFICDLVEVEIGGSPVILESNAKKMKWNIVDMIEDTLHVDVQYYDEITRTYGDLIRRRYLKQ